MNQENRTAGSWFRQQKLERMNTAEKEKKEPTNLAILSKKAKEIRKEGESWKSALKRASKEV